MTTDMPFVVFEIKEYMVIFRQLELAKFGGVTAKVRGIVRCTGVGLQNDDSYQLDVHFLTPDSPVPDPIVDLAENRGTIFFPMSDMAIFVDVLRNEKPIYGHLRADNPQWTSVTTTNEPVGAGDEDSDL